MELLTARDIEGLHHTSSRSFYYSQQDRYEIWKGKESDIARDGRGTAMWYETQLEALISYNHYRKKYKTVLLGDLTGFGLADDMVSHCIIINKKLVV